MTFVANSVVGTTICTEDSSNVSWVENIAALSEDAEVAHAVAVDRRAGRRDADMPVDRLAVAAVAELVAAAPHAAYAGPKNEQS